MAKFYYDQFLKPLEANMNAGFCNKWNSRCK